MLSLVRAPPAKQSKAVHQKPPHTTLCSTLSISGTESQITAKDDVKGISEEHGFYSHVAQILLELTRQDS